MNYMCSVEMQVLLILTTHHDLDSHFSCPDCYVMTTSTHMLYLYPVKVIELQGLYDILVAQFN